MRMRASALHNALVARAGAGLLAFGVALIVLPRSLAALVALGLGFALLPQE